MSAVDHLLLTMHRLACGSPPGVWVCSTEMLLSLPAKISIPWAEHAAGVTVFAVPQDMVVASCHGVYVYDTTQPGHPLLDLVYRASTTALTALARAGDGRLPVVVGLVYICPNVAERLLMLQVVPPLNACTYLGLDDGAEAFDLSLFLDIVYCLGQCARTLSFTSGAFFRGLLYARVIFFLFYLSP